MDKVAFLIALSANIVERRTQALFIFMQELLFWLIANTLQSACNSIEHIDTKARVCVHTLLDRVEMPVQNQFICRKYNYM